MKSKIQSQTLKREKIKTIALSFDKTIDQTKRILTLYMYNT